jgi:hypothetical protein
MKALKMTLILVFCIGLVQVSFGQPDTLWTRTVCEEMNVYGGTAVLQTESGDFIIGSGGWSPNREFPYLFCLDADGNEKWFKTWINDTTINNQFNGVLPEIYELDSNNFLMGCGGYCSGIMSYNQLLDSTQVVIYDTSYGWGEEGKAVLPIKFQKIHDNEYIIIWNQIYPLDGFASILKVNQSGDSLWSMNMKSSSFIDVLPADNNGFVLLYDSHHMNYNGLILCKTNGEGDSTWTKSYGDITKYFHGKCILQTGDGGFIVLTDIFDELNRKRKGSYLLRTDEFGDTLWTKKLGLTAEEDLNKMKSTSDGGFIIIGSTTWLGGETADMLIIKVDALGNSQWRKILGGNRGDSALDVAITKDGGYVFVGCRGGYIWVVRLASDLASTSGSGEYEIEDYTLSQNYPNPFNPSTTIEFDLPKSSDVRIEIYNIAGQKIKSLVDKRMSAGSHQVEFNAQYLSSGVYFYRIEAGKFQDVKKMILLR